MEDQSDACVDQGGPLTEPPPEIAATLRVIGGKWKLLILWQLSRRDCRFNEMRRAIPGVTQHMLTVQLRELEADGIVTRTIYAEIPPKVVYALTPHGHSLRRVIEVLFDWGKSHLRGEPEPQAALQTQAPEASSRSMPESRHSQPPH